MNNLQFQQTIESINKFLESSSNTVSHSEKNIILEIRRRLERLGAQFSELMTINNKLMQLSEIKTYFDQETDTYIVSSGGKDLRIKLKRADPKIPIKINNLTSGSAYNAGTSKLDNNEEKTLRINLETELEAFYHNAHKTLKLLNMVPQLPKIKSQSITKVRNNLIEHIEHNRKEASIYTFGVGATGPRIKPMYEGKIIFNDEGLVPNTTEFLNAINSGFNKIKS